MPYVVTDACTKDFACVSECATAAIAPEKKDPKSATVSQVYINPDECIECGACVAVCPNDAIFSEDALPADKVQFAAKNKEFFQ